MYLALWNVTTLIYSRWNNVTANNQAIIWTHCECIGVVFHFCTEYWLWGDAFLVEAGPKCTSNPVPVKGWDALCERTVNSPISSKSRVNRIWVCFPNVLCEWVYTISNACESQSHTCYIFVKWHGYTWMTASTIHFTPHASIYFIRSFVRLFRWNNVPTQVYRPRPRQHHSIDNVVRS